MTFLKPTPDLLRILHKHATGKSADRAFARLEMLEKAATFAHVHLVETTKGWAATWPGHEFPLAYAIERCGIFPKEKAIERLRMYRAIAKTHHHDALAERPPTVEAARKLLKLKLTRIVPGFLVPSPFQRRVSFWDRIMENQ